MKTFTYDIGIKSPAKTDNDVNIVQFGNGYPQRQKKGLAPKLEHWQASRVDTKAKIDEIKAFLDAHTVTAFWWRVTSDEPLRKYIAKDVTRLPEGGSDWSLTWTMQQVPA